jgi:sugar phosphate isomerase/epimerase
VTRTISSVGAAREFAISQSVVQAASMAEDFDVILEAGQKMVAVMGSSLRRVGIAEATRLLQVRGLKVSSYHAGMRLLELDETEADKTIDAALQAAVAIGAPVVTMSPGPKGNRKTAEADQLYIARLKRAAGLAKDLGVVIGVEPIHPFLCPIGYVHSLRHGAEIVAHVPNCSLVFDTVHLFWDWTLFDDIKQYAGMIGLVHLGQLSGRHLANKQWYRAPLQDGFIDLASILHALDEAGYRGRYEQENLLPGPLSRVERLAAINADAMWFLNVWKSGSAAQTESAD